METLKLPDRIGPLLTYWPVSKCVPGPSSDVRLLIAAWNNLSPSHNGGFAPRCHCGLVYSAVMGKSCTEDILDMERGFLMTFFVTWECSTVTSWGLPVNRHLPKKSPWWINLNFLSISFTNGRFLVFFCPFVKFNRLYRDKEGWLEICIVGRSWSQTVFKIRFDIKPCW